MNDIPRGEVVEVHDWAGDVLVPRQGIVLSRSSHHDAGRLIYYRVLVGVDKLLCYTYFDGNGVWRVSGLEANA
jgi:hypothetical protein